MGDLFSVIIIGLLRFVTIAVALYSRRMMDTLLSLPPLSPIRSSISAAISTKRLRNQCTFSGLFLRPLVIIAGKPIGCADKNV